MLALPCHGTFVTPERQQKSCYDKADLSPGDIARCYSLALARYIPDRNFAIPEIAIISLADGYRMMAFEQLNMCSIARLVNARKAGANGHSHHPSR